MHTYIELHTRAWLCRAFGDVENRTSRCFLFSSLVHDLTGRAYLCARSHKHVRGENNEVSCNPFGMTVLSKAIQRKLMTARHRETRISKTATNLIGESSFRYIRRAHFGERWGSIPPTTLLFFSTLTPPFWSPIHDPSEFREVGRISKMTIPSSGESSVRSLRVITPAPSFFAVKFIFLEGCSWTRTTWQRKLQVTHATWPCSGSLKKQLRL